MTKHNFLIYDPILLKFYRFVAEKCGLLEEDIEFIFRIQNASITRLEDAPTRIKFHLQDKYEVNFDHELEGNAISLAAEGQRNKTTSLLCIATLLGYSWDDDLNREFLEDDEFVQKGVTLKDSLRDGSREAYIELTRNNRHLKVTVTGGKATVNHQNGEKSYEQQFNLQKQFTRFERYLQGLIDVQLVSKGRKFIQRIEADVLNEIVRLGEVLFENSQQAFTRALAKSRQSTTQAHQLVDGTVSDLKVKIARAEEEIGQKTSERKPYVAGNATIAEIIRQVVNLQAQDFDKIQQRHHLNQKLTIANEMEQNQAYKEDLRIAEEAHLAELENQNSELLQRKDTLEKAFDILQSGIVELIDQQQIKAVPEVKNLQDRIEYFNVNGVYAMYVEGLNQISVNVYQALIEAIEATAPDNVTMFPLDGDIRDTNSLLQQLQRDLERAQDQVALNKVILTFKEYLEQNGESLSLTPADYQDLLVDIEVYKQNLRAVRAKLKTIKDTQAEVIASSMESPDEIRKQIQQIDEALSKDAKLVRSQVEDIVASLDKPLELNLNEIWSVNGLQYLRRKQKDWNDFSSRLQLEINTLEEEVKEWQAEISKLETVRASGSPNPPERIAEFQNDISYIVDISRSMLQGLEDSHTERIRQALKEEDLETPLRRAIDQVITQRCHFFYDNSGDDCCQVPLKGIAYQQKGRSIAEFYTEDKVFSRASLSGGTESVMTVRSLASRPSSKSFGVALLVDEWGDVEQIGEPLYAELRQIETILLAIFVKVENIPNLTIKNIN